ncbi:unnamed protein product, partial [Arabidopsis halleri]
LAHLRDILFRFSIHCCCIHLLFWVERSIWSNKFLCLIPKIIDESFSGAFKFNRRLMNESFFFFFLNESLCQRYIESIFDGDDDGFGGSYALRND